MRRGCEGGILVVDVVTFFVIDVVTFFVIDVVTFFVIDALTCSSSNSERLSLLPPVFRTVRRGWEGGSAALRIEDEVVVDGHLVEA